jgi:hypothetical protein
LMYIHMVLFAELMNTFCKKGNFYANQNHS